MLDLAETGAEEGLWLRAERQTGGRGRRGRPWAGAPGNLFTSTLVVKRAGDPSAHTLALVAAVAAHEVAARVLGPDVVRIKWPNDLMVGAAKLCGILLEARGAAIVVGFGMNVATAPDLPDRPATCLARCGAPDTVDAAQMAEDLADRFAYWLVCWRNDGLAPIMAAWQAAAQPLGTPMKAHLPDDTVLAGRYAGIAADGALLLDLADGSRHVIHAADIFAL